MALRKGGIQSFDLPTASPTFLTELGYHFDAKSQQRATYADASGQTQTTPSIVGAWSFTGQLPIGNADLGLALTPQGKMAFVIITQGANGERSQVKSVGQWQISDNLLVLSDENGTQRFQFRFQGNQLSVYFPGLKSTVNFHRMQTNS
jgi:hypothetical protein